MRPTAPAFISFEIVKYLTENKGIDRNSMSVFDTDENTIKIHLAALGLIQIQAATAKGGGLEEFVSLTPYGNSQLVQLMAVRTAQAAK